jgi:hypothetical protein
MMFQMVSFLFVILVFGCSALGVSAPQGKESLPTLSPFPYPCSGPFKDTGKKLSEEDYLKAFRKKVLKELEAHKKWLTDSKDPEGHQANFCGAMLPQSLQDIFQGKKLNSARFQMAMLPVANFTEAKLNDAQLQGANLSGAVFNSARLIGTELDHAMLHRAKFQNADLREASLRHAMLYQAEFHQAKLHKAKLQGANLRDVKGLTQSQINMACLDRNTILPTDLTRPKPC